MHCTDVLRHHLLLMEIERLLGERPARRRRDGKRWTARVIDRDRRWCRRKRIWSDESLIVWLKECLSNLVVQGTLKLLIVVDGHILYEVSVGVDSNITWLIDHHLSGIIEVRFQHRHCGVRDWDVARSSHERFCVECVWWEVFEGR